MTPLLATLASAVAAGSPQRAAAEVASAVAVAPGQTQELYDQILAYRFQYPVSTTSGEPLKMLLTHPPEKYSSAAPLTADARQRIVSELLELRKFVNINVCVGPASGVLKDSPPESWKPLDVALTVLIDRSTSRLTTGQRFALNDVEEAHAEQRPSGTYFVYEHRSQGSPTNLSAGKESFRHALAVTGVRPDGTGTPFLYTLNLSCREEMWSTLQPLFKNAVDSFVLEAPTDKYISPDTRPWQFW
ncbi:hypothetical protein V8C86DRAFT_2507771 [Haematococcus lacustris]